MKMSRLICPHMRRFSNSVKNIYFKNAVHNYSSSLVLVGHNSDVLIYNRNYRC